MAVKINSHLPGMSGLSEQFHSASPVTGRREAEPSVTQVDLSPLSARLQELSAAAAADPTLNAQRVAELRQAIREGRFQVNPEKIADGLLREAQQLLDRQQQRR